MRVDWLTTTDPRWTEVLARARHDFYHLPGYVRLCGVTDGGEPGALWFEEDGEACLWPMIERPIPQGGLDLTSPYGYPGPIATPSVAEQQASLVRRGLPRAFEMLRERGAVSLFSRLHPLLDGAHDALRERMTLVQHGSTVSIDLTLSPEAGFAAYRTLARRHVRAAKRAGLVARHDPELKELPSFIRLYKDTMRRIGAASYYLFPDAYYERLREALGDKLSIWLAELDGRIGAAVLFTEVCGVVQYHLSASDADLADAYPTRLVIDAARCWGHERGDEHLHLGGGVGGSEDSLFFFKAGFSSRRHPFYTARAVLDADAYARLTAETAPEANVKSWSGFFPAYRLRT